MAAASQRYYAAGGHFVALRVFEYNSKNFAVGDAFDWRAIGVDQSKVDELWSAYYIEGVTPEALAEQAKQKATHGARPQKQR
jgi:hypothetical protein